MDIGITCETILYYTTICEALAVLLVLTWEESEYFLYVQREDV